MVPAREGCQKGKRRGSFGKGNAVS